MLARLELKLSDYGYYVIDHWMGQGRVVDRVSI